MIYSIISTNLWFSVAILKMAAILDFFHHGTPSRIDK